MSFQIGVLKVLSTHPDGRASVDAIKRDLVTLASREWSLQLRRLAALAGAIDVFSAGLILRTPEAWEITPQGRAFLRRLQAAAASEAPAETALEAAPLAALKNIRRPQRPLDQHRPAVSRAQRDKRRRGRQQAASLFS